MYPVAINNLVKLACASYLISMSKADTLTFVYKDYRISFSLNYGKKQRRRNITTILKKYRTFQLLSWFSKTFDGFNIILEINYMLKVPFVLFNLQASNEIISLRGSAAFIIKNKMKVHSISLVLINVFELYFIKVSNWNRDNLIIKLVTS